MSPLQQAKFTLAAARPKRWFDVIILSQRVDYLIVWSANVTATLPKLHHFMSNNIGDLINLLGVEYRHGNTTPQSLWPLKEMWFLIQLSIYWPCPLPNTWIRVLKLSKGKLIIVIMFVTLPTPLGAQKLLPPPPTCLALNVQAELMGKNDRKEGQKVAQQWCGETSCGFLLDSHVMLGVSPVGLTVFFVGAPIVPLLQQVISS